MSTTLTPSKRSMVKIGTHSGSFHCDEALGCWLLKHTSRYQDAEIVRSRDPEVLKDLDIIIDVGGVYDEGAQRFDHHQREFKEVFGHGFVTKLSSAGLVYKHFGREVVARLAPGLSPKDVETVYLRVYKSFIEAVDAVDNGINQFVSDQPPLYTNNTTLSARVSHLNPPWSEDSSEATLYAQFLKAVELTGSEFAACVESAAKYWLPARSFVVEALEARHAIDPSGSIIALTHFCPWKEHLYELEVEMAIAPPGILFCLFEDDREKKWRIQAVSVAPASFANRRSLPAAWRGLRDAELDAATGVPGGVFVHTGGFIGGHNTYDGALAMAKAALTLD